MSGKTTTSGYCETVGHSHLDSYTTTTITLPDSVSICGSAVQKNFQVEGSPKPTSLSNHSLATLWRWAENRLPIYAAPVFDGQRFIADYSSEEDRDEDSENPFVRRLSAVAEDFTLDGVLTDDGVYWIDDLMFLNRDLSQEEYSTRLSMMGSFFHNNLAASPLFALLPQFTIFTQSDLEFWVDQIAQMPQAEAFSFRSNNYKFEDG